jgi:hypothetical protein
MNINSMSLWEMLRGTSKARNEPARIYLKNYIQCGKLGVQGVRAGKAEESVTTTDITRRRHKEKQNPEEERARPLRLVCVG